LLTLERVNRNEDMRRLRALAREHSVRQIVVGLPLRLDGTRGEIAEEATRFAARLTKQLGVPVDMIDERLTSWEAERLLEEQSGRVLHDAKHSAGERGAGARVGRRRRRRRNFEGISGAEARDKNPPLAHLIPSGLTPVQFCAKGSVTSLAPIRTAQFDKTGQRVQNC